MAKAKKVNNVNNFFLHVAQNNFKAPPPVGVDNFVPLHKKKSDKVKSYYSFRVHPTICRVESGDTLQLRIVKANNTKKLIVWYKKDFRVAAIIDQTLHIFDLENNNNNTKINQAISDWLRQEGHLEFTHPAYGFCGESI